MALSPAIDQFAREVCDRAPERERRGARLYALPSLWTDDDDGIRIIGPSSLRHPPELIGEFPKYSKPHRCFSFPNQITNLADSDFRDAFERGYIFILGPIDLTSMSCATACATARANRVETANLAIHPYATRHATRLVNPSPRAG